jgi:diguanylate cyclase (GGDEF)-like protein
MAQVDQSSTSRGKRPVSWATRPEGGLPKSVATPRQRWQRGLAFLGSVLLVVGIALLDRLTGPYVDFGIFYLLPVIICAWWLNFPTSLLFALAGIFAWHLVEIYEQPDIPIACTMWNGITRFSTMTLVASLVARLRVGILRERRLARTDPLTGAANGRTFYEQTELEVKRASRTGRPLTLAYIDLDNFKQLNDRQGHAVGDEALIHVVLLIHASLRQTDLLARLGGDEFALLLPDTDAKGALHLLNRIQEVLALEMKGKNWPLSMSVGAVTFLTHERGVDRMIQQVDALMYAAKKKGKGRIEHQVAEDVAALAATVDGPKSDRRATARLLCNSSARVRCETDGPPEKFAVVRDISESGVGLQLEECLSLGTVVVVEPLLPGASTLLARVVRVEPHHGRWLHGCVLSVRLSPDDLTTWLESGT